MMRCRCKSVCLCINHNRRNLITSFAGSAFHHHASSWFCSQVVYILGNHTYSEKKRKFLRESSNYRGIALNSSLSKLLEHVILVNHKEALATSWMQFGFKAKSSTTQCTFVLQETIQYYLNNDSRVYCVLLDASQAFDRVQYVSLFKKMLSKGLCPVVSRCLLYMHTNQSMSVRWQSVNSNDISISNGVKQGGILSPVLFSVYADSLLEKLKTSAVGCHVGSSFNGALAYADDIVLLAPSRNGLHQMLTTTEQAGKELNIKFNPSKSQLLVFPAASNCKSPFLFGRELIRAADSATHLGHHIGPRQSAAAVKLAAND